MDTSDDNFGMQRITTKGFILKLVCSNQDGYLPSSPMVMWQATASRSRILFASASCSLFRTSPTTYALWNDPEQVSNKYVVPTSVITTAAKAAPT